MRATLRHSVRSLRRSPVYTATAILTLALGIGANGVVYAFANAVFVRPLPFPNDEELVQIEWTTRDQEGVVSSIGTGPLDYVNVLQRHHSFAGVGTMRGTTYALTRDGADAQFVRGAGVSATMWQVLGAQPTAARLYT